MRAIRRMAAAGLLLFTACHDGRPPPGRSQSNVDRSSPSPAAAASVSVGAACTVAGGITRIVVQSSALSAPVRVSIVSSKSTDPPTGIVYLLHGAQTDESQWEAIGVETALDDLVAAGKSRPFTVVLPDLPTGADPALDGAAFLDDVVPAVDRCLGGSQPAAHRALGGISRGGSLALEIVAGHGDAFAAVGGHSPAVSDVDLPSLVSRLARSRVRLWLDVGTQDALRPSTQQLANALHDAGSVPELHVSDGGHDRAYWGAHVHDYLQWYASAISSG